jgi:hypothetical protein
MLFGIQPPALGAQVQIENDIVGGPDIDDSAAAIDVTGIDSTSDETAVGRSKGSNAITGGFNASASHFHTTFSAGKGIARTCTILFKDASAATVATYNNTYLHLGYRVTRAANGQITCPVSLVTAPAAVGAWT